MTGSTTPAGEAMREAVARQIRAWASRFGALKPWSSLADTLLKSGPIASELARLTAERDAAREDQQAAEAQNEALHVKLRALAPHGSCACSYDQPGDVCSHHSPALVAAEAALTTQRADHAAEVARLSTIETPRPISEYHEDMGFCLWWILPVCEPPYSGSPLCDDWPEYHTHFTPLPEIRDAAWRDGAAALATTETTDA